MSGYGVVHRVTVYSGLSSSVQLFQVHSATGFANPYLMPPEHTGRRIEIPEGRADPGQLRFTVLDKRNVAGDQTDRFLTAKLGDADGRLSVRHSRVEYDVSDDGGVTYQREFTGIVQDVRQPDKNTLTFSAADPKVDELDEVFDGTIPTVNWAAPASLLPLGVNTGQTPDVYGPWSASYTGALTWDTEITEWNDGYITYYGLPQPYKVPWLIFSDELRELSTYVTMDPALGRLYAPDVKVLFKPTGSSDVQLSVSPGGGDLYQAGWPYGTPRGILGDNSDPPITLSVSVFQRAGDGAVPATGTKGTARIVSAAPPREHSPIHIGIGTSASGVAWPVLVSGLAHGAFGGTGFAIDYPRFNTLIQDTTQTRLRFRVTEGPVKASEWMEENVWPVVGYAPAITGSGALYPVSYDPPTAVPTLTFDGSNTLEGHWETSRTQQYNSVRIDTMREQKIIVEARQRAAFAESGTDIPVDLLEEFDGDRVIVDRDPDSARRQFALTARGLRPSGTDEGGLNEARGIALARAESILDRFQDGPQTARLIVRRQAATRNAMVGDWAVVSVPWLVDIETNKRGGSRVMLITEKAVQQDGTYSLALLDNGPESFADVPTLTSVNVNASDPRHSITVAITPPDPGRAVVELATVASGVAEPASDAAIWYPVASVSGTAQTVTLNGLASRRRHWVRTIGKASGKLPSAYATAKSAHTAAVPPPTITGASVSGAVVVLTWTNGDAAYPIMPVSATTGSGVAAGVMTDALSTPLPAGSTRFQFTELPSSTAVTVGVKHADLYGGDSTIAKVGTSTGVNLNLSAPRQLTVVQGRGDVDLGQQLDPKLGYGLEVSWSPTEPYANTVIHYDTNSGFTAPTAISGITNQSVKILTPLDDQLRYVRAYHQRPGYTTSPASSTVSAKPVALRADATTADGFAGGFAGIAVDDTDTIVLTVGSHDPDVDAFYYVANNTGYVEPTTASSGVLVSQMPYSQTIGPRLAYGETGYLWGKFYSKAKGFGQQVKQRLPLISSGNQVVSANAHLQLTTVSGATTWGWRGVVDVNVGALTKSLDMDFSWVRINTSPPPPSTTFDRRYNVNMNGATSASLILLQAASGIYDATDLVPEQAFNTNDYQVPITITPYDDVDGTDGSGNAGAPFVVYLDVMNDNSTAFVGIRTDDGSQVIPGDRMVLNTNTFQHSTNADSRPYLEFADLCDHDPQSVTVQGFGTGPLGFTQRRVSRTTSTEAGGYVLAEFVYMQQTAATDYGPQGFETYVLTSHTSGTVALAIGQIANVENYSTGTVTTVRAVQAGVIQSTSGGTISNGVAFYASAPVKVAGTFTTAYGLYVESMTAATTNWAVYTAGTTPSLFGGQVRFDGAITLKDGITAPSTVTGYAAIYVDTSDGDLKVKFADGTTKTIATDT